MFSTKKIKENWTVATRTNIRNISAPHAHVYKITVMELIQYVKHHTEQKLYKAAKHWQSDYESTCNFNLTRQLQYPTNWWGKKHIFDFVIVFLHKLQTAIIINVSKIIIGRRPFGITFPKTKIFLHTGLGIFGVSTDIIRTWDLAFLGIHRYHQNMGPCISGEYVDHIIRIFSI